MYKLREEERERYEEKLEKEREQVKMLTKKLELLPFEDRKRLAKLYRKKKAEERKLKELEECDSDSEEE
jgi:hypothetical protein